MRTLATFAVLVVTVGAAPTKSSTVQGNCGYADFDCAGDGHRFTTFAPNNKNAHGYCIGPCDPFEGGGACHPTCLDQFSDDAELGARYEALIAAANKTDIMSILSLAARLPRYVGFNHERRTVQILNCDGSTVIANLPIRSDELFRLAERLPDAEEIFSQHNQY